MSFDEDPYLHRDRKAHWRIVAGVVFSTLVLTATLVVRCGREARQRDAMRAQMRAANDPALAMAPRPAPSVAPAPSPPVDGPPVAFQLVRPQGPIDLDGLAITLDAARQLVVKPQDQWVFSTATWSLAYPSTMQVAPVGDGLQLAASAGSIDLAFVSSANQLVDVAAELAATYEATGRVVERRVTQRRILRWDVEVTRLETTGPAMELAVVPIGKTRHLRILVQTVDRQANPAWLWDVVDTLRLGARPSRPEFEARIVDANGLALETADARLGEPFTIGGETMTVTRRATVREQRAGIEFERPISMTALTTEPLPAVLLRGDDVSLQIMRVSAGVALALLRDALRDAKPIERIFAGTPYRGLAGLMAVGDLSLPTEMFEVARGDATFVVLIHAPTNRQVAALGYAEVVIAHLR